MNVLGLLNSTTAINLSVMIQRSDGQCWDFMANAYAPLTNGVPTATQISKMARPNTVGPTSGMYYMTLPQSYDPAGSFALIFPADGAGNLGTQIDAWPMSLWMTVGLVGGVSKG